MKDETYARLDEIRAQIQKEGTVHLDMRQILQVLKESRKDINKRAADNGIEETLKLLKRGKAK